MWRYVDALPVNAGSTRITLGEGWTPLIEAPRMASAIGCSRLLIKDESQNPTGTFKDRSASYTVTRLASEKARGLVVSSTGNAGSAFAVYAARAGLPCIAVVPDDAIEANLMQALAAGARVERLSDWSRASAVVDEFVRSHGYANVSTGHTPFRSVAKATLAYEIAEQLNHRLPDLVVCPTGGGIALLALQAGFARVTEELGSRVRPPLLMATQHSGCAPIALAHELGKSTTLPWSPVDTPRGGMRTPNPALGSEVLRAVSGAGAYAIAPADAAAAAAELARLDGVLVGLETGTSIAAVFNGLRNGTLSSSATIVVINTATAMKSDPAWMVAAG